jgi:23S rRNA (adenine2503-C2)-methyltransferase
VESFYGQSRKDLLACVKRPARAARVFERIYAGGATGFDEVLDIPAEFRKVLSETLSLQSPAVHERFDSNDGTRRYLLKLADGQTVESVLIPNSDRLTFCISSQIGCALGCTFCLTGQLGLIRDLTAAEIVSQVMVLRQDAERDYRGFRFSLVLMGMGEPLQNYDNVLKAIHILHDDHGLAVPASRITLSTAGLVPAMQRLAAERVFPNLAISLTGVTNASRDVLMPINRKYPIETIMNVVRELPAARQDRVMFECVMIKGVTDSADDARELARLLRGMRAKVNLIPLNPAPEIKHERSDDEAVLRFHRILLDSGIATFVRRNRGNDVSGACGQLKKKDASSVLS